MGRREDFKVWGDLPQLDVPPGGDPRKHMPPVEWKVRAEGEAETLKRLGIGPDESLRWYQNRRSQD